MTSRISPRNLKQMLDKGVPVKVLDVRLEKDRTQVDHPIPGEQWRDPEAVESWNGEIGIEDTVVVYCVHGRWVSQGVCRTLREKGLRASYLEGGIEAWNKLIRSTEPKTNKSSKH